MNARYYNSETGQFISKDTYLGEAYSPWTQNLYSYTGNNPVNYVDPTGHFAITAALVTGFLVGGAFGGFYGYVSAKSSGASGWYVFASTITGAFFGGAVGTVTDPFTAALVTGGGNMLINVLSNHENKSMSIGDKLSSAISSFATGAIWGGVTGQIGKYVNKYIIPEISSSTAALAIVDYVYNTIVGGTSGALTFAGDSAVSSFQKTKNKGAGGKTSGQKGVGRKSVMSRKKISPSH